MDLTVKFPIKLNAPGNLQQIIHRMEVLHDKETCREEVAKWMSRGWNAKVVMYDLMDWELERWGIDPMDRNKYSIAIYEKILEEA